MLLTVENTLMFDARGDDAFEPLEGHGGERLLPSYRKVSQFLFNCLCKLGSFHLSRCARHTIFRRRHHRVLRLLLQSAQPQIARHPPLPHSPSQHHRPTPHPFVVTYELYIDLLLSDWPSGISHFLPRLEAASCCVASAGLQLLQADTDEFLTLKHRRTALPAGRLPFPGS